MKDMTPVHVPKPESIIGRILCWLGHHPPMPMEAVWDYLNTRKIIVCHRCEKKIF